MGWRIVEWSRERGFGKVVHPEHGSHSFDGSCATVDNFSLEEEVDVTLQQKGEKTRVVKISPLGGSRSAPDVLPATLQPSGIFHLLDPDATLLATVRTALNAWPPPFSVQLVAPFVVLAGGDQVEVRSGREWLRAEEALNARLDEALGVQSVVNALTGDARDVTEALERLTDGATDTSSPVRYRRLFYVQARVPLNGAQMTREQETSLAQAWAALPAWLGEREGVATWFGLPGPCGPYLTARREPSGTWWLEGRLAHADWRRWRDACQPLLRGLPLVSAV